MTKSLHTLWFVCHWSRKTREYKIKMVILNANVCQSLIDLKSMLQTARQSFSVWISQSHYVNIKTFSDSLITKQREKIMDNGISFVRRIVFCSVSIAMGHSTKLNGSVEIMRFQEYAGKFKAFYNWHLIENENEKETFPLVHEIWEEVPLNGEHQHDLRRTNSQIIQ